MTSPLAVISVGVVVFAATNIDDILLLSAFFAHRRFRPRAVVVGQFAGIAVLTAASAAAAALTIAVPDRWLALLGLAPLLLGLREFYTWWRMRHEQERWDHAVAGTGRSPHAQWASVAFVTVANGGDNLAVYIPLFSRGLEKIPLFALIFAAMTAVWCAAGYWLVFHPLLGAGLRRFGHVALPIVLTGLGLYLLSAAFG